MHMKEKVHSIDQIEIQKDISPSNVSATITANNTKTVVTKRRRNFSNKSVV